MDELSNVVIQPIGSKFYVRLRVLLLNLSMYISITYVLHKNFNHNCVKKAHYDDTRRVRCREQSKWWLKATVICEIEVLRGTWQFKRDLLSKRRDIATRSKGWQS